MTSDKTGFVFSHVICYLTTVRFGNNARIFKMSLFNIEEVGSKNDHESINVVLKSFIMNNLRCSVIGLQTYSQRITELLSTWNTNACNFLLSQLPFFIYFAFITIISLVVTQQLVKSL